MQRRFRLNIANNASWRRAFGSDDNLGRSGLLGRGRRSEECRGKES
jgi:hypothetical protein